MKPTQTTRIFPVVAHVKVPTTKYLNSTRLFPVLNQELNTNCTGQKKGQKKNSSLFSFTNTYWLTKPILQLDSERPIEESTEPCRECSTSNAIHVSFVFTHWAEIWRKKMQLRKPKFQNWMRRWQINLWCVCMVVLTSHSRLKIVCILKLNLSICLYFQPTVRCKDDYTHTANLFVIASFSFLFAPTTKSVYLIIIIIMNWIKTSISIVYVHLFILMNSLRSTANWKWKKLL